MLDCCNLFDSVPAKPIFCFNPIRKVVSSLPTDFTFLGLYVEIMSKLFLLALPTSCTARTPLLNFATEKGKTSKLIGRTQTDCQSDIERDTIFKV